jgi:cyclopropane fatty-acyl-phospholipid synthase-like methyltransferase
MADSATKPLAGNTRSVLARLRAWAGGLARPPVAPAPPPRAMTAQPDRETVVAPLDRATIGQWLWGKGFVSPGDEQYVLEMVKPFGLTPAMSMLDLSAGLGGPARVIAKAFGTYVTGLERSPERAKRGMQMSVEANLAKRAMISQYNPETIELRPNSFDCILGRGSTYSIVEKERLFRVVYQGLKQRGQLLFNEFTVDPAFADRPELAAWMARESFPPALWSIEQYQDCLTSLGFDIRVVADVTAVYRSMIVAGWARMLKEVDLKAMARNHLITVINEAELWMLRIAALQSGALHVYRVHAILNKPSR